MTPEEQQKAIDLAKQIQNLKEEISNASIAVTNLSKHDEFYLRFYKGRIQTKNPNSQYWSEIPGEEHHFIKTFLVQYLGTVRDEKKKELEEL